MLRFWRAWERPGESGTSMGRHWHWHWEWERGKFTVEFSCETDCTDTRSQSEQVRVQSGTSSLGLGESLL